MADDDTTNRSADTGAGSSTVLEDAGSDHRPRASRRDLDALASRPWRGLPAELATKRATNVAVDCGWGRLVFGQTFENLDDIAEVMRAEESGRRDICLYVADAHVLVSHYPHELFIDPSHTFRLWLHHPNQGEPVPGVQVRFMRDEHDAAALNRIYAACGMVAAPTEVTWANQRTRVFTYLVAEDERTGQIVGTVTGIDHQRCFGDPEHGTSLWCLAVDPQCALPGVGEALVRTLAEHYRTRGRAYLDLSVMHDNRPAIRLYEKLGFERVPVLSVKRKNPINESLFVPEPAADLDQLNPYARIIADEARLRGIAVEVLDAEAGYLRLAHGGREIITRESLSELTTAVAMSRCDDKRVTRRVLAEAGLVVPAGRTASFDDSDLDFLAEVGSVVVKPARGEQGRGITVGVNDPGQLRRALEVARTFCPEVLVEEYRPGSDLRIVVIDHEVVAAAIRRPATIIGNGTHPIKELIAAQSRRRAAATDGESTIPVDDETIATIAAQGFDLDDVLPSGVLLAVRRTANLHTGGTIHDVTDELHPDLVTVATRASRALDIPVTGLDLIVEEPAVPDYVIIEANERPGLANHEPRPTAERFIDLLFPATRALTSDFRSGNPVPGGELHHVPGR
ncbi:MAG: N-acetylglutaminylglutamine synthetase [Acidimicrobiia bacterium]|nr:N-acetylglutaminylglutamine synthetase [Acidimicrobiia bacterium]